MKLTKRKGFNFLRSYFDVLNELEKDKDKLDFLLAIINKQFLDQEPDLKGMSKFAYISQLHSIEKSVKGWKDATGQALQDALPDPPKGCTEGPCQQEQEQEKEQEEEQEQSSMSVSEKPKLTQKEIINNFLEWFNKSKEEHTGKKSKFKTLSNTDINNLKKLREAYDLSEFKSAFRSLCRNKYVQENNLFTPAHFLRVDNFNKYLAQDSDDTTSDNATMEEKILRLKKERGWIS